MAVNLKMVSLKSCAINEIHDLSMFSGNPEGAMASFCRLNLDKPMKYFMETVPEGGLYSYYIFSCSMGDVRGDESNYATQFAAYIRNHNLGDVWASPVIKNDTFHKHHYNQIWVWMPDKGAIKRWYAKLVKEAKA